MKLRTVIFWCHLVSGLTVGSVVLVMAVTGAAMAFDPQIVPFFEQKVRNVIPPPDAKKLDVETLVEKAQLANSNLPANGVTLSSDPAASVLVSFGKEGALFVNPYTGEVLGGVSKAHDLMHWLEGIHRRLGTKEKGRMVTGICNGTFLFMVISGIYIWWPRKWMRSILETNMFFNSNLKGRARDWNWHNVFGFWCAPLLLITTLTGLIMSYTWANNLLYRITGNEPPPQMKRMEAAANVKPGGAVPVSAGFNAFIEASEKQVPGWESINIRLPREPGSPVAAWIQERGTKKFIRSQLTLDSKSADIMKWEPFSDYNVGRKARIWTKPIHTGEAWGLPGQILMFLGACGAVMLVWTGFALSYRRFFGQKSRSVSAV